MSERGFAVIGLGYVGLPVVLALAKKFGPVHGFDISATRVEELKQGHDRTGEVAKQELLSSSVKLTSDINDLANVSFFIVTVPTPIDNGKRPDLTPIVSACELIGLVLKPGAIVVFESTVYPGLTRRICRPLLAKTSGLEAGRDFKLGYSPERINPGDTKHRFESIVKVVSGEDEESLERVAAVYSAVVTAGVHRAPSLEVAEAAKVIENTQRDLNIALMNELSLIFERLGISTADVLAAAGTKWNFLPFTPGLVGGHCIGVDPYYLTARAEELGYLPQVILSGRRINDAMGNHVAQRVVKMMIAAERPVRGARVGILGLTFKEDVPDLRNSRVPDIVAELKTFGIEPLVHDPLADKAQAQHEYGISLVGTEKFTRLDALIYAVPHRALKERGERVVLEMMHERGVIFDVKSAFDRSKLPPQMLYSAL
jgi:UDP-N-acetyl-D-galactosamine dehydrogenase